MGNGKSLGANVVAISIAFALAGCGSNSISGSDSSKQSQNSSSTPSAQPTAAPSAPSENSGARNPSLQGFGIIREFGETDTAAMFGLMPESGTLQITGVSGPDFLGGYRAGELDQVALDHLFKKSANPMSPQERQDLIAKYKGAQVIYFEGYRGALCNSDETEFDITVSGSVNGNSFKSIFQFIALPNASGDCKYHKFFTLIQN